MALGGGSPLGLGWQGRSGPTASASGRRQRGALGLGPGWSICQYRPDRGVPSAGRRPAAHVQLPLGIAAHRTAQLVELHEQLVLQLRLDMALE